MKKLKIFFGNLAIVTIIIVNIATLVPNQSKADIRVDGKCRCSNNAFFQGCSDSNDGGLCRTTDTNCEKNNQNCFN